MTTHPLGSFVVSRVLLALVLSATASAQSLVEPEQIANRQHLFDSAASAPQLRCRIDAIHPSLDYALRFRTGYVVEFPMLQFQGSGHNLNSFLRVTPEGQKPVYLEMTGALQEVPGVKVSGQIQGTFVVGEGTYDVEALMEDESHRACHNKWRIQARRSGSERELTPSMPAATVAELTANTPLIRDSQPAAGTRRLTLMVYAASFTPGGTKLHDSDVSTLVGSLYSLLQQLPAERVRLIVFNLGQRAVIFRQDGFTTKDLNQVATAMNQLQLAKVDYRTLQQAGSPAELLTDLVHTELKVPHPADALILLGPRLLRRDDIPVPVLDRNPATVPSLFYLQFQPQVRLATSMSSTAGGRGGRDPVWTDAEPQIGTGQAQTPRSPLGLSDNVEKLVARLKGKTIAIRSPHDLADGIRRIEAGMGPTVPPTATVEQSNTQAGPKVSRPAVTDPSPDGPLNLPAGDKLPRVEPTPEEDPVELLIRLRNQVLEHAERIPNHTCVETIERARFEPVAGRANKSCDTLLAARRQASFPQRLRLDITDRLRLDVAVATEGEIYSWAGAGKFEEGEIDQWLPEGAIGTGPFASFLLALFEDRGPEFVYAGRTALDGRSLAEYSFSVPQEESHYRVKAHKDWVITGYTGTLLVDPKTAELVRFRVRTEELPPATTTCETDTELEYESVRLESGDYLLPKVTHQKFIGRDGAEDENVVTFSACRDFHAESMLTFGGGTGIAGPAPETKPVPALDLPPGLPVTVETAAFIDANRAAAGDQIEGRLTKPIRDARQKTLVPEGAVVHGRLMRVEIRHSTPLEFTVALRWESIEVEGVRVPFSLRPDRRPGVGTTLQGLRTRGMRIELPRPGEDQYGVYHSRADHWESGLRTEWLTGKP